MTKGEARRVVYADVEQLTLRTGDGWHLDVTLLAARGDARGVVVCGHAMMVDRRTLWRPDRTCLVEALRDEGLHVILPDLRGHGRSGPGPSEGGEWSYDALVDDTSHYLALALERYPNLPVSLLGHSLFGHTSLAWLGRHPGAPVRAMVAIGVNLWSSRWVAFTPGWRRRQLHRAFQMLGVGLIGRLWGYIPARRLRVGSADESLAYWRTLERCTVAGRWAADDGWDYRRALPAIRCPVLHVLGEDDRLNGHPEDAEAFLAPLGQRRRVLRVGPYCDVGALQTLRPNHMGLVTDPTNLALWRWLARWLVRVTEQSGTQPDEAGEIQT